MDLDFKSEGVRYGNRMSSKVYCKCQNCRESCHKETDEITWPLRRIIFSIETELASVCEVIAGNKHHMSNIAVATSNVT